MCERIGVATSRVKTVATATSDRPSAAARTATRPRAPDGPSDPTLATSIEAISGITVIRMRLTKIVPTGVRTARIVAPTGEEAAPSARPSRNPATRPIRTRVVRDTRESYYGARIAGFGGRRGKRSA